MFYIKFFLFLATLFFLSCSNPTPAEPFSKGAIFIEYSSSRKLNMYTNEPHVIPLIVYQLSGINSFNALKKDKAGIIKLLEAKKFDASVMSVSKHFISPDKVGTILLDRASKTKWVALVAGYYDMQVSQSTLVYKVPEYNPWKFLKSEKKQKLLNIQLYFNRSSIEKRYDNE